MKWIGIVLLGSLSVASCAQQNFTGVQRADAFMQVRIPGTIPVAPGKNKPRSHVDTTYIIYIQARQHPGWTKAWTTNHAFHVETTEINDRSITVGVQRATGKEIFLETVKGHRMYRLVLEKIVEFNKPEIMVKEGEIFLKGVVDGKDIFYTIKKLTELQSPLHQ